MLASLLLTAIIWPVNVSQYCQPTDKTIITGVAQNPAGTFLYCEQIEQLSEHTLHINYIRNEKIFAEKILNYSDNPATPSVQQKDFRFGELRRVDILAQTIQLQYQPNTQEKSNTISIPRAEVDVIDAGFDVFIRNHWDKLQAGKTVQANFASTPHLKVLPLRISAKAAKKCGAKIESFCFMVEIDNGLLRLLLGNIQLTYDEHRRLIKFDGIVNIEDEKELTQTAEIHYYYQTDYVQKQ